MLNVHTKQPNLTVNGVAINVPSITNAVASIVSAAQHGENFSVCTLNLDHVVKLQQRPDFRAAYHRARFVTADGFPIVMLSRLLGTRIERTTGADLVEPLCREAGKNRLPIFLLGSDDHTLATTAQRLAKRFKGLKVAGYYAPGSNFDPYSEAKRTIAIDNHPRLRGQNSASLLSALRVRNCSRRAALMNSMATAMLCIGAALDFIVQERKDACAAGFDPEGTGLEWAWRMLREPRRLGPRYARCAAVVPGLVARTIPQIFNARMRKAA